MRGSIRFRPQRGYRTDRRILTSVLGEQAGVFLCRQRLFYLKIGLFFGVGLLSIYPTVFSFKSRHYSSESTPVSPMVTCLIMIEPLRFFCLSLLAVMNEVLVSIELLTGRWPFSHTHPNSLHFLKSKKNQKQAHMAANNLTVVQLVFHYKTAIDIEYSPDNGVPVGNISRTRPPQIFPHLWHPPLIPLFLVDRTPWFYCDACALRSHCSVPYS